MQPQARDSDYEALRNNFKNLEEEFKSLYEQKSHLEQLYAEEVQSLNSAIDDLRTRNRILTDQFSKEQEQKNHQIRQLIEKLETLKTQKEKEQPVSHREVYNTMEIQREIGGEKAKASHLSIPGLGQARSGRNASISSIQNMVSRDNVDEEGEFEQRRSAQERGSVSARGSEDKEELKEAQKLLRIKTREYEEVYKRLETMRKDLEEKESKIVRLEEEAQEKQDDYKALYEEFSKNVKQERVDGETDSKVLEERIKELEEIVEDNKEKLREKIQEQIRELQKVIGKEVGKGLEKSIEEFIQATETRLGKLNKQITQCHQLMRFVGEEVAVWKNKALETENEWIKSLEALDEVNKNKEELEQRLCFCYFLY